MHLEVPNCRAPRKDSGIIPERALLQTIGGQLLRHSTINVALQKVYVQEVSQVMMCLRLLRSFQIASMMQEITQLPLKSTTVFEYDLAAENPAQENCSTQVVYQALLRPVEWGMFQRQFCDNGEATFLCGIHIYGD